MTFTPPCLADTPPHPARPARQPKLPKPGQPPRLYELAALLESQDERVQVEVVPAWEPSGCCDVCAMLECYPDARVMWVSPISGEQRAEVNASHLDGWAPFLLADCVPDEGILIEIGGAA